MASSVAYSVQKKPEQIQNIRETIEKLKSILNRLSETRPSVSGPIRDLQNLAENGGRRSETRDDGSESGIASPKSVSGANENIGVEPVISNGEVPQSRSGAITDSNNVGNDSHLGSLALPNNNNGGNDCDTDNPATGGEKSTSTNPVLKFFKKLKKKKRKQENQNVSSALVGSRRGAEIGETNENLGTDQMSRKLKKLVNTLEGFTSFEQELNLSIQNLQNQLERFLRMESGSIDSRSAKEMIIKEIKKLKNQIPSSRGLISADSNLNPSRRTKKALTTRLPNLPRKQIFTSSKAYKEIKEIYDAFDKPHQDCFLCFAVFPENEVIKRRLLTYWWLGENFINQDSETAEKTAKTILDDFQAKGLIEPVITKKKREYRRFRMPPLVRAAAIELAQNSGFFDYDSDGNPTANLNKCNRACLVNGKATQDSNLETKPEDVVAIFNVSDPFPDLALEELSKNEKTKENNISVVEWVMKMKKLKVLLLGRWQSSAVHHIEVESTDFLEALKNMKALRFLSLQGISWINELPKSIKSATEMKILDLKACHNLEVLPKEIGSLHNLTHLDISDCFLLDHLPRELSSLLELRVLKGFVICSENTRKSCSLPNLVELKKLRKLSVVSNRVDFPNAKELDALRFLGAKGALRKLTISWGWRLDQVEPPTIAKSKLTRMFGRTFTRRERMENPGNLPKELVKLDLQCYPEQVEPPTIAKSKLTRKFSKTFTMRTRMENPSNLLPKELVKLDLQSYPEESPPQWLSGEFEKMEKLYIRGGRLSSLGGKQWDSVEILKLKYLSEFKGNWMKLREDFPKLIYLEKTNCPGVSFCPTDEHGVWQKPKKEEEEKSHENASSTSSVTTA